MNKKSFALFIIWMVLSVGLIVFMIAHICIEQYRATHEEIQAVLFIRTFLEMKGILL